METFNLYPDKANIHYHLRIWFLFSPLVFWRILHYDRREKKKVYSTKPIDYLTL